MRLLEAIRLQHGTGARWLESVHVREVIGDVLTWEGQVEVFELTRHPIAARAYAWSYPVHGGRRIAAVLALPPTETPQAAVRAVLEGRTTEPVLKPVR